MKEVTLQSIETQAQKLRHSWKQPLNNSGFSEPSKAPRMKPGLPGGFSTVGTAGLVFTLLYHRPQHSAFALLQALLCPLSSLLLAMSGRGGG